MAGAPPPGEAGDVEKGESVEPQPSIQERVASKALKFKEEMQAKDPVQKGRCTLGTLSYFVVFVLGLFFFGFGCSEEDVWEIIAALFLVFLSGYALFFLGGDPCLLDAFREQVNLFFKQNERFKESNEGLETKLTGLGSITAKLEDLGKQMRADANAAEKLLNDMERFSALQTVSAVVNQFFASDWDGSGHINGDEAQIFIPQLSSLWSLVPSYDPEQLVAHVRDHGMTLTQLSVLLECLVADDKDKCLTELEKLTSEPPPKPLRAEGREVKAGGAQGEVPAQLEELYEEASMPNVADVMGACGKPCVCNCEKDKDQEYLKPLCECGPFQIWSILHLVLMLCAVAGLVFTIAAFVVLEVTNIVGALIGICLASGLMAAGRLIEVLRALRVQVKVLRQQNDYLEVLHEDLTKKVSRLSRLQKGYDVLQSECAGNVDRARDLIMKSNTNTKMSAMAVVTRIFRDSDVNKNQRIDQEEVDNFVSQLQLAFGSVGGWNAEKARVVANGLTVKEMKSLVDSIVTVDPDLGEPTPPTSV